MGAPHNALRAFNAGVSLSEQKSWPQRCNTNMQTDKIARPRLLLSWDHGASSTGLVSFSFVVRLPIQRKARFQGAVTALNQPGNAPNLIENFSPQIQSQLEPTPHIHLPDTKYKLSKNRINHSRILGIKRRANFFEQSNLFRRQ